MKKPLILPYSNKYEKPTYAKVKEGRPNNTVLNKERLEDRLIKRIDNSISEFSDFLENETGRLWTF